MKQTRLHPRLSRMTSGTLDRFPGNLTIVTFSAELPICDLSHADIVRARPHLKNGRMTDLAFELYPMIPVGENYRRHVSLFGFVIEHQVAIVPQRLLLY